jgi:hypothetical protein
VVAEDKQPTRFTKRAMKERAIGLPPRAYTIPEFGAVYSLQPIQGL